MTDLPTGDATQARILRGGYQFYDGPRTGSFGAMRAVTWQGIRSALGLGRKARFKIVPILTIGIAFVPAIIFVGVSVLFSDLLGDATVDYSGYYGFITASMVLFTGFVTPEALTADRRSGLLGLYLSTPLTRSTYLFSRLLSVIAVLLLVTIGPLLLVLLGYTFLGLGPDGFTGWLGVFFRILGSGALIAAVYTAVAFAIASLTDRRAVASTAIVLFIMLSAAATGIIVEVADTSDSIFLLNLVATPFEAIIRLFGDDPTLPEIGTWSVALANAAWIAVGWTVAHVRYLRIRVA